MSFQNKQCYWRCSELITLGKAEIQNINNKYKITLDDSNAFVRECPPEWMDGIVLPQVGGSSKLKLILEYFDVHGIETFEGLNIWHVSELHKEFVDRTGRNPQQ